MLHINGIKNNQIFTNLSWAVLDWNLDKKHNRLGQIPLYIELQKTKPSNKVEEQKGLQAYLSLQALLMKIIN